jgi:dTMP kinase
VNKRFISFEGGDGAGKSTLIESVYQELVSKGKSVLKTRAPGGTATGEKIRQLLLHQEVDLDARCELFLFLADRAEHVKEIILPALKKGSIVLCDRFNDSSVAYQGAARGLDEEKVRHLCLFATNGLEPDLTFYLDLDPKIGFTRIQKSKQAHDRIESEDLTFHQKIRLAFHRIAHHAKERMVIIDASKTSDEVFKNTMNVIYERCF